jgi:hypothetical protein
MRLNRIHLYAAALLLTFAMPASAFAGSKGPARQSQVQARNRGEEGLRLYGAGRWQEAFDKLSAAEALHHAPIRLLYMARCQHKLEKLLEARALYEQFLAEKLPKNPPEALLDARASAKKELEIVTVRAPKVKIVLRGVPKESVRLSVDGAPVQAWSGELVLNPGKHTIEVTAANTRPLVRSFTLNQGTTKTINLQLRPRSEASTGPEAARRRGAAG